MVMVMVMVVMVVVMIKMIIPYSKLPCTDLKVRMIPSSHNSHRHSMDSYLTVEGRTQYNFSHVRPPLNFAKSVRL